MSRAEPEAEDLSPQASLHERVFEENVSVSADDDAWARLAAKRRPAVSRARMSSNGLLAASDGTPGALENAKPKMCELTHKK